MRGLLFLLFLIISIGCSKEEPIVTDPKLQNEYQLSIINDLPFDVIHWAYVDSIHTIDLSNINYTEIYESYLYSFIYEGEIHNFQLDSLDGKLFDIHFLAISKYGMLEGHDSFIINKDSLKIYSLSNMNLWINKK